MSARSFTVMRLRGAVRTRLAPRIGAFVLACAITAGMSGCALRVDEASDRAREDALDSAASLYDLSLDCLASLSGNFREDAPTAADLAGCFDTSVFGVPVPDIQVLLAGASFLLRLEDDGATWKAHAISVGVGWAYVSGRNASVTLSICWSVEVSGATGDVSDAVDEPCGRDLLDHTYGRGGEANFDDINARRPG